MLTICPIFDADSEKITVQTMCTLSIQVLEFAKDHLRVANTLIFNQTGAIRNTIKAHLNRLVEYKHLYATWNWKKHFVLKRGMVPYPVKFWSRSVRSYSPALKAKSQDDMTLLQFLLYWCERRKSWIS